ncbi:MAG TPA: hypothetical protein VJU86_03105 [Pyrinomonadaceae bacterium]|nr:hypothetical protein [Pyrinomonadaceae bacterium]
MSSSGWEKYFIGISIVKFATMTKRHNRYYSIVVIDLVTYSPVAYTNSPQAFSSFDSNTAMRAGFLSEMIDRICDATKNLRINRRASLRARGVSDIS